MRKRFFTALVPLRILAGAWVGPSSVHAKAVGDFFDCDVKAALYLAVPACAPLYGRDSNSRNQVVSDFDCPSSNGESTRRSPVPHCFRLGDALAGTGKFDGPIVVDQDSKYYIDVTGKHGTIVLDDSTDGYPTSLIPVCRISKQDHMAKVAEFQNAGNCYRQPIR